MINLENRVEEIKLNLISKNLKYIKNTNRKISDAVIATSMDNTYKLATTKPAATKSVTLCGNKQHTRERSREIEKLLMLSINPILPLIRLNNASANKNLYTNFRYSSYSPQNLTICSFISNNFVIVPPTF